MLLSAHSSTATRASLALLGGLMASATVPAFAQGIRGRMGQGSLELRPGEVSPGETNPGLEGVGIEQHLEAKLPMNAAFVDRSGKPYALGQAFGELPVVLTLNFFDCPQLCSLQLSNLAQAMGKMGLQLGEDYRVVTISIDPKDTPKEMGELHDRYVANYLDSSKEAGEIRNSAQASSGWICLSGTKTEIDRVTETAGFGYRWDPVREEFAHQAANILCSPEGTITRYLEGVDPEMAGVLRLSLVEASDGKVGTLYDGVFLNCFIYDPTSGQYNFAAITALKVAAALTVLAVATGVLFMKRGDTQPLDPPASSADDSVAARASERTS